GGLSGFLKRSESEYDTFGAGHASTALSAALGMAVARDLRKQKHRVVAVVGDGAMTGGLCYEALNNGGYLGTDITLILNDNEMSISNNVGAISRYFNRIITGKLYNETKAEIEEWIEKLPKGRFFLKIAHKLEETLKGLIVPGLFFEELGWRYIGPIDGHDLDLLIPTLEKVRDFKGPVVVHCFTKKGKGYHASESDPIAWHGPPPFKVETGEMSKSTTLTYTHVYGKTLIELAEKHPEIVALTGAMTTGTGLDKFEEKFPDRFFDVGIAEAHAVCTAAGMATAGLRPFATIYSTFLQRAYDQIIHDVALQKLPVIFALDRGGLVGKDGPTHHGAFDLSYLRLIPNMVVMAPKDEQEMRCMMATALAYTKGPVAFRYPRGSVVGVDMSGPYEPLEIGKGEIVRQGRDVAIYAIGLMVQHALKAADLLEAKGLDITVVNMRFVKPMDADLALSVAHNHSLLLSMEDNVRAGGFGSAISEIFQENKLDRPLHILALPDKFVDQGDISVLHHECGLSPQAVADTILNELKLGQSSKPKIPAERIRV
ncbi:MAG: 1-deoxy-D-xylulose-5-phosphate synthase, partial [bacterium]